MWSVSAANGFDAQSWNMGIKGAMFQMIGHGISSAGMFFMVGVVYDRVHHRNLNEFGGLYGRMPVYTALAMIIFFAGLGLPGLCGFIGEVFVVLSVWNFSTYLAVISASVVVLDRGLHPVGHPTRVPGAGIQGAARRGLDADHFA